MKTVVFPDSRHRLGYIRAVLEKERPNKVIYLGDWLDYRAHEGGDRASYKEVLDFMIKEMRGTDRVNLLSNHDANFLQYLLTEGWCRTLDCGMNRDGLKEFEYRFKNKNADIIYKSLIESVFPKCSHIEEIGGAKVLFTHAGLHQHWAQKEGFKESREAAS